MIFDEPTLRKLSQLALAVRQVRAGAMKGERRSVRRGTSIEFADYRNYSPGDDLRRLDWNAYARLDRPYLKLFEEEEDLAVHILLDASGSMDWGSGEQNKFRYAVRLAAGLSVAALAGGDRLAVQPLEKNFRFGPVRGQGQTFGLLQYMETLAAGGQTDLGRAVRDYTAGANRPGLAVLISDLFSPGGLHAALVDLQGRGYEAAVVQVLAPDELDPELAGDLRLVDVENGQAQEVSIDAGMLALYQQRLETWQAELRAECRQRGVAFVSTSTAQPWERTVFYDLRRAGILR